MNPDRSPTLQAMDRLEALVMKQGWPVPCTPYYLINHERLLGLMDNLRATLQDEMDERFVQAFGPSDTKKLKKKKNKNPKNPDVEELTDTERRASH